MNRKTIIERPPESRFNDDPFRNDPRYMRDVPGADDELGYEPTDDEIEEWLELQTQRTEGLRQAFERFEDEGDYEFPEHPDEINF